MAIAQKRMAYSYVRFSRPEQAKGHSSKRQKDAADIWCEKNGYVLDTSIKMTDKGLSGWSGEHRLRGKLGAFIRLAEQGKINPGSVLIVESLDRLTREEVPVALMFFLDILVGHRIEIVTLLEPEEWFKPDTLKEVQLIIAIVILSRAHNESAIKSERLRLKWIEKRRQMTEDGIKLTARTPSWIVKTQNEFTFHPDNAAVVRRIVRLYLDGNGVVTIVRIFNEENINTLGVGKSKAKQWGQSSILKILRNRALIGEFQPHLGRKSQDQSQRTPIGDPISDYFPPLITEPEFYRIQNRLSARKPPGRTGTRAGSISNLFTGLIYDARDGFPMHMVNKGKKSCGNQIVSSAAKVGNGTYRSFSYLAFETAMLSLLKSITPDDIVTHDNSSLTSNLESLEGSLGALQTRIRIIQRKIENDNQDLIDSLIPVLSNLSKKQYELEEEIEQLKSEIHTNMSTHSDCSEVVELVQNGGDDIDTHRRRCRDVLIDIIQRIDVLVLSEGHWRQCFSRVTFENGRTRIVVACVHRKRFVMSGGYDGDYPIDTTKGQEQLQKRLGEIKVRSVAQTEENVKQQLLNPVLLRPGIVELGTNSVSIEDWPSSHVLSGAEE